MAQLLHLTDVEARLKLVLGFFGNDITRFSIHLGRYLSKNQRKYLPSVAGDENVDQSKQDEKKKETKKVTTNMDAKTESETDSIFKLLTSSFDQDIGADLLSLLKSAGTGKISSTKLVDAQRVRRASALGALASTITTGDGRKMSSIEKNEAVIGGAIKLADQEEKEDEELEDDFEQEEFRAGDDVVIIEGDNCGLFGTLQHSTGGIFGIFDDAVKEDEEGNFGVDIHPADGGEDEGFWIHPEAMQHKKYTAGDEVKVIDGINVGRFGSIQSEGNGLLRFDAGSYGVDVKMEDGSVEGYWIHPTSMVFKDPSKEKKIERKTEEDLDLEEVDKFEFLPYIAFPGDAMDEALGEHLNTLEIDINVKRIIARSGQVVYRYGGRRHLVRFIHGVLLVKENGVWTELIPELRKLAGMDVGESDIFSKPKK